MSAQDAQKEVVSNLVAYAKGGPDAAAAKEQVINIMAAQQHTNHDEAAKRFDNTQAKLQRAGRTAAGCLSGRAALALWHRVGR